MPEAKFENIHILVAEDNDISRFIIDKMLRVWEIKTTYVQNGEEAVQQLSSQSFDLILMDIEMPRMNGYQATELIRAEIGNTAIPIIAMTGHATETEKNKCFETGMSDYISKPFQVEELRDKIAKWISPSTVAENDISGSLTSKNMETAQLTNLDFLREISAGNESFFKEFITLFLTTAPVSIKDMEICLENKDWETLRQVSHKIKPSFNYVGLKELSQAAARIEEYAKNKSNLNELPALISKIKDNCNIAFKELEVEIQAGLTS